MGAWLAETEQAPQHCFVSSALRTRKTYEYAQRAGEWDAEMEVKPALYASDVSTYLSIIQQCPDHIDRLLIVGHEPTCSMTTSELVGDAEVRFPTAAMARIDLDISTWKTSLEGEGTLVWFMPPRFFPK